MRCTTVASSLFLMAGGAAWCQSPSFEAASVKPAAPNVNGQIMRRLAGGPGSSDPGQINWSNVTVKIMVTQAFGLKDYQVEGPEWIDSLGYDIVAKMAPGTTSDQMGQMLQALLKERFKLEFHRETKQLPIYALVVAKGGSKMKEADVPQAPPAGAPPPGGRGGGPGVRMMQTPNGVELAGTMTMTQLANMLTRQMGRAVQDATELGKSYHVDISWMPEELEGGNLGGAPHGGNADGNDSKASLRQALQEQLGLRLEPRKSTAEVLIVDRAEKVPVEN